MDQKVQSAETSRVLKASRNKRFLLGCVRALIIISVIFVGLGWCATHTERGTRYVWVMATKLLHLSGQWGGGTLANGVHIRHVEYRSETQHIQLDRLDTRWHLSYYPLKLTVDYVRLGAVEVYSMPSKVSPAPQLPKRLTLPLSIVLKEFSVDQVNMRKDNVVTQIHNIWVEGQSDRVHHQLNLKSMDMPNGTAHANMQIGGVRPFIVRGEAEFAGAYQQENYHIHSYLSGSLELLRVQLNVTGVKLNGQATLHAAPFSSVLLQRAHIAVHHLNPKVFIASLPQADLTLSSDMGPVTKGEMPSLVGGHVSIENEQPGAVDKDRFPFVSLAANVQLSSEWQKIDQLKLKLLGNALIEGQGELHSRPLKKNQVDRQGQFVFNVHDLDLKALHTQLQPAQLGGVVTVKMNQGKQTVAMQLANHDLKAQTDVEMDEHAIHVKAVHLAVGSSGQGGQFELSGMVPRDVKAQYAFQGMFTKLDPALWVKVFTSKNVVRQPVSGRVNASFEVKGSFAPERHVKFKFGLKDSIYNNLPMSGNGVVEVLGRRLLPSDIQLSIAGNQAVAKGGFGAPSDRLSLNINAPSLNRLGFGVSGLLQFDGLLTGSFSKPSIHATYRAEQLVLGSHRLAKLSGQADIQTQINDRGIAAENSRVAFNMSAQGYKGADIGLDQLEAKLNGTYGQHSLSVQSRGQVRGKSLILSMAAQGKLSARKEGYSWDGTLQTFENKGWARFMLRSPMIMSVAPNTVTLGSSQLTIANALIDLKSLSVERGRIRSEGRMSGLNIGDILELQREFTGKSAPVKSDLVLDGAWNVVWADVAKGFVTLTRRQGDLTIDRGYGKKILGLSALSVRADLEANRIKFNANIVTAPGTLIAQGQASLQVQGGQVQLMRDSALSGQLKVEIPKLRDLTPYIDPNTMLDGRVALDLKAAGTVGQPSWSGNLSGDALGVTFFDQGIQLHDGIARIVLTNNVIDLRQVEFHGGEGTLRAVGQVQLGKTNNPELRATINASQLQLYADPKRTLVLSGEAKLAKVSEQFQVDGQFTVDRGLFDLPKTAPHLGDDVVIVHKSAAQEAKLKGQGSIAKMSKNVAPKFPLTMNLQVNLGDNLRFKGSDADVLLRGTMNVRSEQHSPMQAIGTVRVSEGTYEVFGRKLAIERGLIHFQGPLDNPNINILAMRRNQDVEAGVQITGNVRQLRAKLVSEPNVGDEEKLSWLILGHGTDNVELGQRQAVGAALALLANSGSKHLAQGVGLDELSLASSDSASGEQQQVVHLGKAISDRFYVGYEQSLDGATSLIKATWRLSRRWSAVVRTGAINSLDILFNRRFDCVWKRDESAKQPGVTLPGCLFEGTTQ